MIILRFKETFRERMPEWALGTGMMGWGFATIFSTGLFVDQEFYHPLANMAPQPFWGWAAFLGGLARIIFLIINGAWRPSAHIRAIGCGIGSALWGALVVSSLNLGWLTPASSIYTMLLCLDVASLWFAAGDAKLSDLKAKGAARKK